MSVTSIVFHCHGLLKAAWASPALWDAHHAQAAQLLREALAQHGEDHILLRTCLGAVLCDHGRNAEAVSVLAQAVQQGSTDRHTHGNLAVALVNLARHAEAQVAFEAAQALPADPRSFEAYFDAQGQ